MKKLFYNLTILFTLALVALQPAYAQKDVATVIKMGTDNASKLSEAYLTPFGNALGAGLNNSWYNTAKVHKTLGFDVTFSFNAITIPDIDTHA